VAPAEAEESKEPAVEAPVQEEAAPAATTDKVSAVEEEAAPVVEAVPAEAPAAAAAADEADKVSE